MWARPVHAQTGAQSEALSGALDLPDQAGCILAELLALRPLFQGEERKASSAFQADQLAKCAALQSPLSAAPSPPVVPCSSTAFTALTFCCACQIALSCMPAPAACTCMPPVP